MADVYPLETRQGERLDAVVGLCNTPFGPQVDQTGQPLQILHTQSQGRREGGVKDRACCPPMRCT